MSGYHRYSMSNNAVNAYYCGEKPKSKWTKQDILNEISKVDKEKAAALKKVRANILKEELLLKASWHHTSNRFNKTDFFMVDISKVEDLSAEDIARLSESKVVDKPESKSLFGDLHYLEWSGTRKHPKAMERVAENVNVIERGCFYIILDKNGDEKFKKKISGNGTRFVQKEPDHFDGDVIVNFKE